MSDSKKTQELIQNRITKKKYNTTNKKNYN